MAALDSYAVFRELHSPEFVFADAFLMFEKIMDLGIKDMFYVGESPPMYQNFDEMSLTQDEKKRMRRQRDIEIKEYDASRTALRKRCYKVSNHMLREVDEDLHEHL